MGLVFLFRLT